MDYVSTIITIIKLLSVINNFLNGMVPFHPIAIIIIIISITISS